MKCLPRTPPNTSWGCKFVGSFPSIPPSRNQSVQSLWGWESLCGTSSVPYLLHWTVLVQSTATLVYLCTAEVSKTNQTICYLKAVRLTSVVIQRFSAMAEQNLVEGNMFWETEVWHNEMCLSLSEPLQNYTQCFLRRHGEALLKTWASGYSPQERKITSQMSSRQQWEYMKSKWRLLLKSFASPEKMTPVMSQFQKKSDKIRLKEQLVSLIKKYFKIHFSVHNATVLQVFFS